jgi:NodT family efflux transporter outer membrane factor (OMF) lipoprotein
MKTSSMNKVTATRVASIAASALLLSACAVGPEFKTPENALPQQWHSATEQFSASDVDAQWWRLFNDPVLTDLVDRALQNNADVKIAALRVAESRVQFGAASGARWPSVNASAAYSRERQSENGVNTRVIGLLVPEAQRDQIISVLSQPFDVYQAGFDAAWELDLWGRVRRSIESANSTLQVSAEDLHDAQLSLVAEVVRSYVELRGIQEQIRIADRDVELSTDLVELTSYRVKGGIVDELDLSTQRARLADTRANVPALRQSETQIRSALALLLNVEPGTVDASLDNASTTFALPQTVAAGVPSEVARRRPDIRRAEARLHAATAEIGVAVADLYPRITLTGNFVQQSLRASDLTEWGSRQWSIGPSISLPIFDGSRRRSVVEIRNLQQQEAAVNYQRTVLRAWHEIENALSAYSAEQQRNRELASALTSGQDAYDIAHVRYSHGLVSFLVELDAHRTLLQLERAYADSKTQMSTQLVAIYKALGGGWSQTQ